MKLLKYKKDFEEVLAHYKVSDTAKTAIRQVNFVAITGGSSGGKDTIIRRLQETGEYHVVVSDTTRAPRINNGIKETNGVEYWFKSEEEMLGDLREGQYLEAEIIHEQQVSGISIRELKRAAKLDKIAINAIDPIGVTNIFAIKPDTTIILILPPSYSEWKSRLYNRGKIDESEVKRRSKTFKKVFELVERYPDIINCVINDNLENAIIEVDTIAKGNATALVYDNPKIRPVLDDLLTNTNAALHNK